MLYSGQQCRLISIWSARPGCWDCSVDPADQQRGHPGGSSDANYKSIRWGVDQLVLSRSRLPWRHGGIDDGLDLLRHDRPREHHRFRSFPQIDQETLEHKPRLEPSGR